MKVSSSIAVVLATTLTEASVLGPRAACPPAWTLVSQDLTKLFLQADGQCSPDARAAVRAAFHDCGTWNKAQGNTGGCDGSVILSPIENARVENRGLQDISQKLRTIATSRGVGVADIIAYAGAHATVSCPLGPTVKTLVGRKDNAAPAPNESLLPGNATLSADVIIGLFADKGFSAPDVAALIGAHTSAQQFFVNPALAGAPQDRTPGIWDVDYYSDTSAKPPGVFTFQSDINIANDPRSGPTFKSFVGQQARWNQAFADTFGRMVLLGVDQTNLIDCTSTLPPPRDSFPGANTPEPAGPAAPPAAPPGAPTAPRAPTGPPVGFPSGKPTGGRGGRPSGGPPKAGFIAPTAGLRM